MKSSCYIKKARKQGIQTLNRILIVYVHYRKHYQLRKEAMMVMKDVLLTLWIMLLMAI